MLHYFFLIGNIGKKNAGLDDQKTVEKWGGNLWTEKYRNYSTGIQACFTFSWDEVQRNNTASGWTNFNKTSLNYMQSTSCEMWGWMNHKLKSSLLGEISTFFYSTLKKKDPLEKEMATHSSVLAGRIPGKGDLGGLPSMGSHRVRHDWSDLAAAAVQRGRVWLGRQQCSW